MGMRRSIGIAAIGLFITLAAASQEAGNYRSIAVMDFRFSGISQEQMQSVVDRLSLKILESQAIRRVVSREQREQLLQEADRVRRQGSHEKNQLHNATIIEVELAVLGEIRKDGNVYRVNLWLLDVASGDTLYGEQISYRSVDELIRDTDRLASELAYSAKYPYTIHRFPVTI